MTFIPLRISRIGICAQRNTRHFATLKNPGNPDTAQNLTEKIVQRYAVDLPAGKFVKSGDYVSIKPEHCMSHDNCISLPVGLSFSCVCKTDCSLARRIEVQFWEMSMLTSDSWE
jgi:hypothetical protein